MPDYVAVTPDILLPNDLKHYALLFDKMAVLWFGKIFGPEPLSMPPDLQRMVPEWEWLGEQGFLLDPESYLGKYPIEALWKLRSVVAGLPSLRNNWPAMEMRGCRQMAMQIRSSGKADAGAFSVCAKRHSEHLVQTGAASIAHIVLRSMPRPSELTPWEAVFEFRDDPDIRGKFYRFKNWMNQTAAGNLPPIEVEDQIQQLLFEYSQSLKIHHIQEEPGAIETFVTIGAEVAESIATLKFSKAAQAIFSIKHRKAKLLDAEMKAPGREIAYIASAESRFGDQR